MTDEKLVKIGELQEVSKNTVVSVPLTITQCRQLMWLCNKIVKSEEAQFAIYDVGFKDWDMVQINRNITKENIEKLKVIAEIFASVPEVVQYIQDFCKIRDEQ